MRRLLLALLLISVARRETAGQVGGGSRHSIAISLGRGGADERDESVSPLRYRGSGWGVAIVYAHEPLRARTAASVSIVESNLDRVRSAADESRADQARLGVGLAHLRQIRALRGNTRVLAGAVLDATLAVRQQRFGGHGSREYIGALFAIAPAMRIELRRGPSRLFGYEVSVPVLTGILQPHSDFHLLKDPDERAPSWRSIGTARAVRQTLSYTARGSGHWGTRAEARIDLFAYDVDPPLAGMRSFAAVSLVRWL